MQKEFDLKAESENLKAFRRDLQEILNQVGLSGKAVEDLTLAVNEAFTNVIRHSYGGQGGRVKIRLEDLNDRVEIRIRDFGKKFDPSKIPPVELPPRKPGGLGLYLIQQLTDKAHYDQGCQSGNELILTKYKKGNT